MHSSPNCLKFVMRHKSMKDMNLNPFKWLIQIKPHDQDDDGRLGYEDMVWLVKARGEATELSKGDFDDDCKTIGATDKLMTKDQLHALYEVHGWSIEKDWAKLRALRTKVWRRISMEKCETGISCPPSLLL